MSSDASIKFDGVDGESVKPKGEIEVLSWNWGVSQPSGPAGGGSGKGKAIPGDFHFVHLYDKASPVLAKKCVSGTHFKDAKLTARKAGEGQQDFLVVTMKEVFITSVSPGGSHGGDILEQVTCSYKDVEFAYKPQDDKGGLGGEVKFGWDVAKTETR
ncbi:MAG TPA: type VI secretion system tube protein Hcp [Caldimonas sp.]|jgi:type VI secretion system secreted protein Hcp|nr:type VI secretion system tube protein Hcp [Caldimonas sp.]